MSKIDGVSEPDQDEREGMRFEFYIQGHTRIAIAGWVEFEG